MNIFITGNPGCGKSTLVQKLLAGIVAWPGVRVAGIITPEIRERGKRQGFRIVDLASGAEEILASPNTERGPGVSRYRVNVDGIDRILDKFLESFPGAGLVVVDEIGMMEFYSRKFRETMDVVLSSGKPVVVTVSRKLTKDYEGRGELLYLTRDNFDEVYAEVFDGLKSAFSGPKRGR